MAEHATRPADSADSGTGRLSAVRTVGGVEGAHAPVGQPAELASDSATRVPRRVSLEQQPTVISSRPLSAAPTFAGPGPLPLGQDMEGRMLGHFRLEQFVGGGGMGSVYRAADTVLGRTVAVKVLARDRSADTETIRRFENEAQSAARLDHENIARVYYVGEQDGLKFIVFEYIEGSNIRDLVRRDGPLPLKDAISYVLQIAEAISHAARRDVVHRDIKPSNVLVTPDGRAKLVDMGLARVEQTSSDQDDLTATGVTLGTFDYISPEQARDPRTADVRSDLYSLGCTFYFMLTGRPPFPEGTVLQKLLSHSSDEPADPQTLRPDLPDEIANILRRLLAKHPDQRFQEPSRLVGELLLAAQHLGLHPTSQGATVWISSQSPDLSALERHLPWAGPTLILMVVVLSLEWFWPAQHPPIRPRQGPTRPALFVPEAEAGDLRSAVPADQATTDADPSQQSDDGPSRSVPRSRGGDTAGDSSRTGPSNRSASAPHRNLAVPGPRAVPPTAAVTAADDPLTGEFDAQEPPSPGDADSMEAGSELAPPSRTSGQRPAQATTQLPPASKDLTATTSMANSPATQRSQPDAQSEPRPVQQRPEVLVVGDYDPQSSWDKSQYCASLQAACRRAMTAPAIKTIELRYDGYRQQSESPFTLANPDLTIRAADGYVPMVRFQPDLATMTISSSSMIRVVGGRLRIEGVQFELDVPADLEVRCQLFQLEQVEELELERCFVTIRDPAAVPGSYAGSSTFLQRDRAAAIDLQVPPGSESMMDQSDDALDAWSVINLWNCVIRGEATFVRALQAVPFRLKWSNGLLATSSRMLSIGAARSDPERQQSHIRVDLQHVTAVVQQGLCRVQGDDDALGFIMTTDLNCSQCIFVTRPDVPLIEHLATVDSDPAELDSLLLFSGERNFYENVNICWSRKVHIRHLDDQLEEDQLDAEDWKSREKLAKWDKVKWRRQPPGFGVPLHQHTPADYYLEDRLGNPAVGSGAGPNGENAGLDPDALPAPYRPLGFPSEEPSHEPFYDAPPKDSPLAAGSD